MNDDDTPHPPEEAAAVETYVERRNGRWEVDIVVIFEDGAVRKTVNTYYSEKRAIIAASWIKRAAQRDLRGPIDG